MRYLILLCLITTALSAQVALQLEQGITVSDNINYKPIGIGLNYQAASWKGFDFSVGLAFDQVTLEEKLIVDLTFSFCGFVGCTPRPDVFVKSYESRLVLPFGISRTAQRFTYGFQVRPSFRFNDGIRTPNPSDGIVIRGKFGENLPFNGLFSDQSEYRVDKSPFVLQIGTDFRYALAKRISLGMNYRYEGVLNDEIIVYRSPGFSNMPREVEYSRGQALAHLLVASLSWQL